MQYRGGKLCPAAELDIELTKKHDYSNFLGACSVKNEWILGVGFKWLRLCTHTLLCTTHSWMCSVKTVHCALTQLSDLFADTKRELEDTSKELEETGKKLEVTTGNLHVTTSKLRKMTQDRDEQKHLVGIHVNTEHKLHSQATQVFMQSAFSVLFSIDVFVCCGLKLQ